MVSGSGPSHSPTRPSRATRTAPPSFDRLDARVAAVFGAFAMGLTGPLLDLSGASASTASFYRALFAVPLLVAMRLIVRPSASRQGARPSPRRSAASNAALRTYYRDLGYRELSVREFDNGWYPLMRFERAL